ncbi:hypothetical protein WJ59_11770 [Burkholderia gladioli]|uniref:non-ribosomal peptide synthetase n=1 Tax=Burkholderia gladioli TaxID=28095 RepID=UPI00075EF7E1|nr:non-ribosomal peptide synthetase [Burkholderia gladioli]KVM69260.1 hypothetical protein WJ59_11770 [Burkholderia gladioli]
MKYLLRAAQRNIHAAQVVHDDPRLSHIGAVVRVSGRLDPETLWQAARFLTTQSPALRSSLHIEHDAHYQVVHESARLQLMHDNLDLRGEADPEALAQRLVEEDFARHHFASDGATIANRLGLIQIADADFMFYAKFHHALFDGFGTSLFYTRLCDAYRSLRAGRTPTGWSETPVDALLADEQAYLASERYSASRRYWAERLASYEGAAFPRATSLANRRTVLSLSLEQTLALRAWAQARGASLFHLFAAALQATLFRVLGLRDIALGLPILNRRTANDRQTIGMFLGFCVLREAVAPTDTIGALIDRIAARLKADYRHQRYPLDTLSDERGRLPFEVSLSYEHHDYGATFDGTETVVTPLRTPAQSYPLRIYVRDFSEHRPILIDFDSNDSCFGDLAPEQFVASFATVLNEVIANGDARLVPQLARHDAPAEAAPPAAVPHRTLCDRFERTARRFPDSIAVSGDSGSLSYARLDMQANALAWRLRALGAGPETRIGIATGRDIPFALAMLAVLKTGAAYVPLDTTYPGERLQFLIDDSAMIAAVGTTSELACLPDAGLPRIDLSLAASPDDATQLPPPRAIGPHQAAYVIYTSGSTGTPKGCIVTHENVLRLFEVTARDFALSNNDIWSVFHSTAFDFSVWELWGALLHGGQAAFVPYETSRDPAAFADFLRARRVSVLSQTPSAFRLIERQPGTLPELRLVVFGGEALAPASLRDWFARYGDVRPRLVNMYGITETTVHVTARTMRRADADAALSPIGEPLADLTLCLLDPHGEPVLDGVAGEIHVGGAGVTRGYLNRPGLTAARFVPDPAGPPGSRRYRAGDLARRRANGETHYLGRADQQVKIRGFRIEPAEVEAVLRAHPGVSDAALILDHDGLGAPRLVAYVAARPESGAPAADTSIAATWRGYLAGRLPAHMVPAHLVVLPHLPMTVNGKLDRRALPRADEVHAERAHEPPATATERLLAEIWHQVLGHMPSRHDSFFSLGGDSINALSVVSAVRERGSEVTPRQLRECPTLATLAEAIDRAPRAPRAVESAPAPFSLLDEADRAQLPDGLEDALPMSRLQLGMLFHRERDGGAVFHDLFRYRLQLSAWNETAWRHSFDAVVHAHAALRTVFAPTGFSIPLQLIRRHVTPALRIVDSRGLDENACEAALEQFARAEQHEDFDIEQGPMLRLFIHRLTDDIVHLTLSFHHAIVDGWSVATLMTELIRGACGGQPVNAGSDAPVLALHAASERRALADSALRANCVERLSRWPAVTLPDDTEADTAAPAVEADRAAPRTVARMAVRLGVPSTTALLASAQTLGVELRSVLLTAHLRVLSQLCGSDHPVSGHVVHNRPTHLDAARAVGLFLNTVPLGVRLVPGSWSALVRQVAAAERELAAGIGQMPLSALSDQAGAGRLFDLAFNYVHFHVYRGALALPDVTLLGFAGHEETDFPLLVQFTRDPDGDDLELSLHYDTARFGEARIERHRMLLETALTALTGDLDASWLAQPGAATDAGRPSDPYRSATEARPRPVDLSAVFERTARRFPDSIAVSGESGSLSYARLDMQANALAWRLRALGAGPETRIGIATGRDIPFALAMLAVLKTGAAYVPLDTTYPGERLQFLIDDSAMIAAVGTTSELACLPDAGLPRIDLSLAASPDDATQPPPPRAIGPHQAAYVIYTSGSTGTPKGCIVTHENVLRLFEVTAHDFALSNNDIWSVFHSTAFDFSVWELWGALLHGGQAAFVPYETSRDPAAFADFLRARRVSVLSQTPSAFRLIERQPGTLPELRLVVFGGEALAPASLRDWFARYGDVRPRLVNMYGITETTVHVTARTMRRADADAALSPIGEPLADLTLCLLDPHGEPVLDGVAGEIHVGGAGVTRGYLNRPGLTAARFVPDPAGPPGSRRYRAGDLARRRANGETHYLGRADQQVKIRGFRIEPAEVEAVLRAHPGVSDAALILDHDGLGAPRLVAYVAARPESGAPAADASIAATWRGYLAGRLPAHMVPAHLVVLPHLPMTVNGKLDRRALPRADEVHAERAHEPPATATERLLAEIWHQVLGHMPSRHDNFFSLGGDSIASLGALNAARRATGIDLPLHGMFAQPTLRELAAWVDGLRGANPDGTAAPVPVRRAPRVRTRISVGPDGSHPTTLDNLR